MLLFGLANLLLFFVSVAVALTHDQGGRLDRLIIVFSPLSAPPPWIHGILLTVLAFQLPGFTFITARFDTWPGEFQWSYAPLILRHLLLPMLSILLSKFFQSVFVWRALFLLHYDEVPNWEARPFRLCAGRVCWAVSPGAGAGHHPVGDGAGLCAGGLCAGSPPQPPRAGFGRMMMLPVRNAVDSPG